MITLSRISLLCLVAASACAGADSQPELKEVLSWLPADTETVIGANGPFAWKDFDAIASDSTGLAVLSSRDLKLGMQALAISLFGIGNGGLETFLKDGKVALVLEGSRRFRSPKGLGTALFEGCAITVFADPSSIDGDAFMHQAASSAKRVESFDGVNVAQFEQMLEQDLWTTYVAFPRKNVVLVASNEDYLRTVLARIRGAVGTHALPDTLPEWKYVDTSAPAWGVRHYERNDSNSDPTSPFHGQDAANFPDPQAVGVAFWFKSSGSLATLTYLSSGGNSRKVIDKLLGPNDHMHFRQAAPDALECSVELAGPTVAAVVPMIAVLVLLGHAVFL